MAEIKGKQLKDASLDVTKLTGVAADVAAGKLLLTGSSQATQALSLDGDLSQSISGSTITLDVAAGAIDLTKLSSSAIVPESSGISSNDTDNALPTAAAVKDYVDTSISSSAASLNFTGDSGTDSLSLTADTLSFIGGANITTAVTDNQLSTALNSHISITSAALSGDLLVGGDLTVNGTTTTVNSTTVTVDDKNLELGSVATPTDVTADGGGITLKGATDKTFNWVNANDSWTSSEHINLAAAKEYKIGNASVLTTDGAAKVQPAVAGTGLSHNGNGAINVDLDLDGLADVTITSATNGQVISYNSTSGEWENSTPSSGATDLDGLSDVTITTPTSGQILKNNGSGQFVNVALSIVDDTNPQLGGALDVNGNAITSASNGNVTINPDGTGDISVGADIIPDADATHTIGDEDNRFISLYSDVNGAIRFKAKNDQGSAITKGQVVYIKGISGDVPTVGLARANSASTMPGFGLALANANDQAEVQIITFGNLTAYNTTTYSLSVGDTVYVSAATAGALTNSAPASETNLIQNIGKVIRASATEGIIKVGGAGRSAATPNLNDGKIFLGNASNQAVSTALSSINLTSFNNDLGSTYQPLDAQLTDVAGLTPADGAVIIGDGANFVTESGATARTSLGAIAELSEDSTPQLSGDLDLNGQDIVTTSNADLDLAPDGTGAVVLKGNTTGGSNQGKIKFNCENNSHAVTIQGPAHSAAATYTLTLPVNDGDADQVLKTDGSGVLAWVDQTAGQASSTVVTASLTALAVGGDIYTIDPTASAKVYIPLVSNTNNVSDGDRIKVENLSAQTMQISSGRPLYTGVGELAPYTYLSGSNLWSNNKYRIDLESRGTVELVYQGGNFYSSYYPAIETSVDSIAAGDYIGYSKVRNSLERSGEYVLTANINGQVESLFKYVTAYDEATARTITFPNATDPNSQIDYCEALDGRAVWFENRGLNTLTISEGLDNDFRDFNNAYISNNYILKSGESAVAVCEWDAATLKLYVRFQKYGYFPARVIESDSSATNTTLSTGTELEKVVYVENGSTTVTMTLPTISGVKDGYLLTLKALGSADVTVSRGGTDTIDGATSSLTLTQNQSVVLAKASSGWNIVQAIPASASVSAASETTAGIIEIATDAEAGAGSVTDKALVPSNVSSLTLSPSQVTGLATVATSGAYTDLSGTPTLGTAAALDVGTSASNVVQLDGSARLPVVDGSQLTNLPSSGISNLVEDTSPQLGNNLDPNGFGISGNLVPSTANNRSLGSSGAEWSDLYIGDSGKIFFGNDQDVELIHDPDDGLILDLGVTEYSNDPQFELRSQNSGTIGPRLKFNQESTNPATNDRIGIISFTGKDSGGTEQEYSKIQGMITDTTAGAEVGRISILATPGIANTRGLHVEGVAGQAGYTKVNIDHDGNNYGLHLNNTLVTARATELNLLDGDSTVGSSITIADTDGVIVNDGGTSKLVPASDLKTYIGVSSGGGFTYSAKTSATTAQVDYHYSCGAGNQSFTVTLPAASSSSGQVSIKNMGTGTITIGRTGGDTIDGAASDYTVATQYAAVTLISNELNGWEII